MTDWISVYDEMPEVGCPVLVSNGGFVCECVLNKRKEWRRCGATLMFMQPTYWMPMPEPPQVRG